MADTNIQKEKKRKGTYDAYLVHDSDPLHEIMTQLMGTRTENEAVCHLDVEIKAVKDFVEQKNNSNPQFKYTFFQVFLAALSRTIEARPKLNYFVRNKKYWERKVISLSFVAKKQKVDNAEEGLVICVYKPENETSPLEQIRNSMFKTISEIRKSDTSKDDTLKIISSLLKLPGFLFNIIIKIIKRLDRKGRLPKSFVNANPYNTTCFVSNLGSIKMDASYHHLINFGTNSIFIIVGKIFEKPVFKADGTYEMKEFLPVSLTLDERIADGVYYANSLKYLKALLLKPEVLDLPAETKIDYEALFEQFKDLI